MRRILCIPLVLALAALALAAARAVPAAEPRQAVTIRDFSFGPASITVHVGDTVAWANAGPTDHTATADDGAFDTGTLKAGQSGSHAFASAGTFAYHCTLHPTMRGTVQVVAASNGGGGSAPAPPASSGDAASVATPAGPALPSTGLEVLWLVVGGTLCLLIGLLLRVFIGRR